MSPKSKPVLRELTVNILGYREEGQWVALALEMDLRGRGDTFEDAAAELEELIEMQVSFAYFKNKPELILKAADPVAGNNSPRQPCNPFLGNVVAPMKRFLSS